MVFNTKKYTKYLYNPVKTNEQRRKKEQEGESAVHARGTEQIGTAQRTCWI